MYFGFSPELNAAIEAGVAKYGQLELAKRFLFHYMRENGVTYGDAWQCLMELPESCFEDSVYFRKVEQFYAKYAKIVDEDSAATVEESIRCFTKNDVLRSILGSSNDPVSRLLYNACHAAKGLCWDEERIQDSFAELDNETGIPDFHPPAITFSTPIASLADARKAVAARKDLDRPLTLLDTWGFESPTQFLVVAILSQDYSAWEHLEAYSAAGKTWFGWWLVEHYFPYHIDCPDGCDSGEPARGRKDPPYFQMSYGSLDNIPDLVDPLVESPLPVQ